MGKEFDIERKCCDHAEALGLEQRKLAWVGRRDAPDRIFWGDGVLPFVIEFKAPGEEPRRGQLLELLSLQRSGIKTYAVDALDRGKEIIDAHAAGSA